MNYYIPVNVKNALNKDGKIVKADGTINMEIFKEGFKRNDIFLATAKYEHAAYQGILLAKYLLLILYGPNRDTIINSFRSRETLFLSTVNDLMLPCLNNFHCDSMTLKKLKRISAMIATMISGSGTNDFCLHPKLIKKCEGAFNNYNGHYLKLIIRVLNPSGKERTEPLSESEKTLSELIQYIATVFRNDFASKRIWTIDFKGIAYSAYKLHCGGLDTSTTKGVLEAAQFQHVLESDQETDSENDEPVLFESDDLTYWVEEPQSALVEEPQSALVTRQFSGDVDNDDDEQDNDDNDDNDDDDEEEEDQEEEEEAPKKKQKATV